MRSLFGVFLSINGSLNFFLYIFLSPSFRKTYQTLFRKLGLKTWRRLSGKMPEPPSEVDEDVTSVSPSPQMWRNRGINSKHQGKFATIGVAIVGTTPGGASTVFTSRTGAPTTTTAITSCTAVSTIIATNTASPTIAAVTTSTADPSTITTSTSDTANYTITTTTPTCTAAFSSFTTTPATTTTTTSTFNVVPVKEEMTTSLDAGIRDPMESNEGFEVGESRVRQSEDDVAYDLTRRDTFKVR